MILRVGLFIINPITSKARMVNQKGNKTIGMAQWLEIGYWWSRRGTIGSIWKDVIVGEWGGEWGKQVGSQTPSVGLRHPSFNHCRIYHVIGSRKLSANEKFFVGAQTVVSLLQTIQIKQGVSFIAANKVYTLSLIHIWRCRRGSRCRSRWSPYH